MCQKSMDGYVRITRCVHGTYHLTLNGTTLHLDALDLQRIQKSLVKLLLTSGKQFELDLEKMIGKQQPLNRFSMN